MFYLFIINLLFIYFKGGPSVMSYYKGSLVKALNEIYPDLILEDYKFKYKPRMHTYFRSFIV